MPAATPRLALPYPTPDDQVDVPRDVEALAEALEAIKNLGMVPQCYLSGTFTANTGGGVNWTLPAAGSTMHEYPPGSVANNRDFTIPVSGWWRFEAALSYQNAGAGQSAGVRLRRNSAGVVWGSSNGIARVVQPGAAQYPTAGGFIEGLLNAGDVISPEVFHTETASRAISWYMAARWVSAS
jgi:hypothetical protein